MQPTRRQALLGGLVLTAACTTEPAPRPAVPSRDERLRAAARQREQSLVDAYLQALRERPELTAVLAPVLGDHAAHLAALGAVPTTPTPLASGSPPPPAAPRPRAVLLRALAAQERATANAHAAAAEVAEGDLPCSRELAPLLASLAASEASHLVVL